METNMQKICQKHTGADAIEFSTQFHEANSHFHFSTYMHPEWDYNRI